MIFDDLLLSDCLIPERTYKENGVKVSVDSLRRDETVIFFYIDDAVNPRCRLRQKLGAEEGRICDLLIFYARRVMQKNNTLIERTLCFVELKKGGNLGDAAEQVIETYDYFEKFINKHGSRWNLKYKAFIVLGSSTPKERYRYENELKNKFGERYKYYNWSSDGTELVNLLREDQVPIKGKRKQGKKKKGKR